MYHLKKSLQFWSLKGLRPVIPNNRWSCKRGWATHPQIFERLAKTYKKYWTTHLEIQEDETLLFKEGSDILNTEGVTSESKIWKKDNWFCKNLFLKAIIMKHQKKAPMRFTLFYLLKEWPWEIFRCIAFCIYRNSINVDYYYSQCKYINHFHIHKRSHYAHRIRIRAKGNYFAAADAFHRRDCTNFAKLN